MIGSSTLLTMLAKPLLTKSANVAWENRNHLSLFFKTKFGKYRDKDVRFSMSGLFKIQIPDSNKYLLVFNRRIENQLQPVGGAFKRFGDDHLFNQWGYRPDNAKNGLDVDAQSSSDLRFMVRGSKVVNVLDWFESSRERELDVKREFTEELIDTKILDSRIFRNINSRHIRRFSKTLSWSEYFTCYEVLTYDVFELIPDDKQKHLLVDLSRKPFEETISEGYAVVTSDEIEQLRLMRDGKQVARIGQHSKLLINQTF